MRRERRVGLANPAALSRVKGDEALGRQVCRDMAFTTLGCQRKRSSGSANRAGVTV